jgi:hypothetical protein
LGVRGFVLSGTPSASKTTSVRDLLACNDRLQESIQPMILMALSST